MFEKKFKVRIRHQAVGVYTVEYAYYRFLPVYFPIVLWNTWDNNWKPVLRFYEEAKNFAQKFKSIEDVNNYHAEQETWQKKYEEEQEVERQRIKPVEVEQII